MCMQVCVCTVLLQGDDHGAGSEGVPGRTVVGGVEVGLHHVVDGEGGEDSAPLGLGLALLHSVPLQQSPFLLLPHVLLPRPNLQDRTQADTHTHTGRHTHIQAGQTHPPHTGRHTHTEADTHTHTHRQTQEIEWLEVFES